MHNHLILSNLHPLLGSFEKLLAWPHENSGSQEFGKWLTPAVDVKEDESGWTFYADLPGVKSEDIDVHAESNSLVISAKHSSEVSNKGKQYVHTERRLGSYHRRFTLPETADIETIAAHYENGVLKISVAKKASLQPKKISVAVN